MIRPFGTSANRNRRHRGPRGLAALAILAAWSIATIGLTEPSDGRQTAAHAARSLNVEVAARLHLVRAEGSQLFEEGPVSGAFTGSMRAELKTGAVFTGSFTTRAHGGSIKGHGRATPHGSGRYQSFSGWFVATGGNGRYAHVSGRAGLYGVFDRRNDAVVVQTTGRLSY